MDVKRLRDDEERVSSLESAALSVVFARRTLGGRTGDTLGATVTIAEVAVCVVLLGMWQG